MFGYPQLLWFLALAALVPLVHLIRLRRERRTTWAATKLLEAAIRRASHRTVPLSLLLGAVRTLIVALLVLLFAAPVWRALYHGPRLRPALHMIVVDDSLSTAEADGTSPLFARVAQAVEAYLAAGLPRGDRLTVVRTSRITSCLFEPDFESVSCDRDTLAAVARRPAQWTASDSANDVDALLDAILNSRRSEKTPLDKNGNVNSNDNNGNMKRRLVWFGDFRAKDWDRNVVAARLERLRQADVESEFHFVRPGVSTAETNLSIVKVEPESAIVAVDVPIPLAITVKNRSSRPSENTPLSIRINGEDVPGRTVPRIGANAEVTLHIAPTFTTPGMQRLEFTLPPDALAADKTRYITLDVPERLRVLLVVQATTAGTAKTETRESAALATLLKAAMAPDADSGIAVDSLGDEALDPNRLARYDAVLLCGFSGTRPESATALRDYVRSGGALVFVPTNETDYDAFDELLVSRAEGPFALSVHSPETTENPPVTVSPHATTRVFEEPALGPETLRIRRFCRVKDRADAKSDVETVMTLDRVNPLIALRAFGKGHVAQWFTSPLPAWSEWASRPSFPVVMLDTLAWLDTRPTPAYTVGDRIAFAMPAADRTRWPVTLYRNRSTPEELATLAFELEDRAFRATFDDTSRAGVYAVSTDGVSLGHAVNTRPSESDLALAAAEVGDEFGARGVRCVFDGGKSASRNAVVFSSGNAAVFLLLAALLFVELCLANIYYYGRGGRRGGVER